MTVRTVRVHEARDVAQAVLSGLPSRWRHTVGVARCAEELAATLDADDGEQLVAAAWLHDIGYAEDLVDTGFHLLAVAERVERQLRYSGVSRAGDPRR